MNDPSLGRLAPVDLETVWDSEPAGFTPWLARPDNLRILGDALGLRLELEAREKAIGPLRADIVCREIGTGARVLIENQLGRTDHIHLGQTLTYAAGLDAAAVVWLARRFTDEHRGALDWLNAITGEAFRFFGLEIELWRIDDSRAAPKFSIASRPQGQPRLAMHAAQAMALDKTVGRGFRRKDYWTGYLEELVSSGGPVAGYRKAAGWPQMVHRIVRVGFAIVASTTHKKRHVRVQLCVSGGAAKERFGRLERQKADIERELGYPLEWEGLPRARGCRVSCYLRGADPDDESDWPRQHEWLAKHVNDMHRVFAHRIEEM